MTETKHADRSAEEQPGPEAQTLDRFAVNTARYPLLPDYEPHGKLKSYSGD